jgi:hypothetical protein
MLKITNEVTITDSQLEEHFSQDIYEGVKRSKLKLNLLYDFLKLFPEEKGKVKSLKLKRKGLVEYGRIWLDDNNILHSQFQEAKCDILNKDYPEDQETWEVEYLDTMKKVA